VGFTRAVYLTIILPTVIALFRPKRKPSGPSYTVPSDTSYSSATRSIYETAPSSSSETDLLQPTASSTDSGHDQHHNSPTVDLNIARISLLVEMMSYILMAIASTGSAFTVFTAMGSFGAGFMPAVESLALAVYLSRGNTESGSLFGALSVMHALGGQLISPILFGFTYAATVGTFPQTIFVLCAGAMSFSLVLVTFVRVPKTGSAALARDEDEEVGGEMSIDPVNCGALKSDDEHDVVREE